ncbi:hypothetical protein VTO73DRAFT_12824 [Trametes versicolor]
MQRTSYVPFDVMAVGVGPPHDYQRDFHGSNPRHGPGNPLADGWNPGLGAGLLGGSSGPPSYTGAWVYRVWTLPSAPSSLNSFAAAACSTEILKYSCVPQDCVPQDSRGLFVALGISTHFRLRILGKPTAPKTSPSASLVSLATTATQGADATPSSSTTTLVRKPAPAPAPGAPPAQSPARAPVAAPAKNYEAAFATLSSSYGFAGTVLTKNPKKKKEKKTKKGKGKAGDQAPSGEAPAPSAQGSSVHVSGGKSQQHAPVK